MLKKIATKIYPKEKYPENFSLFLKERVMPLNGEISSERGVGNEEIYYLMDILKDEDMVKLLSIVHKTILPYFLAYADKNRFMSFQSFCHFSTDFGIFPDYISKPKLHKFFNTLSTFFAS